MALITEKSSSSPSTREIDPLLKDLSEKKQRCRQNAVSIAAELKEVRSRLASQERLFAHETLTRQEAESKAKELEEKITKLQKSLEERNGQLQASASNAEKPYDFKCKGEPQSNFGCRFLKCEGEPQCKAFKWVDSPQPKDKTYEASSSNTSGSNVNVKVTVEENGKKVTYEGQVNDVIELLSKKLSM